MARPIEWTEDRLEEAKLIYLKLLRDGLTEDEIDKEDGVPCWNYRAKWKEDQSFSDNVQRARAIGTERILEGAEKVLKKTYEAAVEDKASPQLVSITDQIVKHARWKASKYSPRVYGDKTTVETEKPIEVNVTHDVNNEVARKIAFALKLAAQAAPKIEES